MFSSKETESSNNEGKKSAILDFNGNSKVYKKIFQRFLKKIF